MGDDISVCMCVCVCVCVSVGEGSSLIPSSPGEVRIITVALNSRGAPVTWG